MLVTISMDLLTNVPELNTGTVLKFNREGNQLFYQGQAVSMLPTVMQQPEYDGIVTEVQPLHAVVSIARFADLHRHSDNSLLDGICKVKDMARLSVPQGALTDHGVLYGFLEFYKEMRKAGKKPIIGCEVYVENLSHELSRDHLILLAENDEGYHTLMKIVSNAYTHMKGGRPHILLQELRENHNGLIATSACIAGTIAKYIRAGQMDQAETALQTYLDIFGASNFYLEIQRHGIPDEKTVEMVYRRWAKEKGLKVIATTDSHYASWEDKQAHEIALCMQTGKTLLQDHMKFEGTGYHIHTSEEMEDLFQDYPEALENTLELASRCQVEIHLGDVNLPRFDIPEPYQTPEEFFSFLCESGFKKRFSGTEKLHDPRYKERYDYEMEMIKKMGFVSYFLIVWDFINFARSHNIYVGPGRGSAAGSLLAYCIGMTDLDPIELNLLFERFLNPERVSWPDVDTDFEHTGREAVIDYIRQKYGEDRVCRIITFGTEAARMVIKDVGRVLGYSPVFCGALAKKVPAEPHMTIQKALEDNPELKNDYESRHDVKKILDFAMKLEGCKRHASQHACGLVISPGTLSNFLPTALVKDNETGNVDMTSQVIMTEVEELSLLKMDLLGLKNMTVIHESIDAINRKYGTTLDYHDIPLDDRATIKFLSEGHTGGVFQLESPGMTKVVTRMLADIDTLPDEELHQGFERLIAAVALYRPGPMAYIDDYIAGMQNPDDIHYDCPEVQSILQSTYGQIIYQEQVMQIVQKLAGYTLGRADIVRKAMGKKKIDLMEKERKVFIYGNREAFEAGKDANYAPGCIANGISEQTAEIIWSKMADFAKYAFNRSHAACYAYIAMITAWLSCHYPEEFYAAMLNAFCSSGDKFKSYLAQASRRGLRILPPDVNASQENFFAHENGIRYGLKGLKGMDKYAGKIVNERNKNGAFLNFQDFYKRMRVEKKAFEALLYAGALDGFQETRRSLFAAFPKFVANAAQESKAIDGQLNLFDGAVNPEDAKYNRIDIDKYPEFDGKMLMRMEHEILGFYLSIHPADAYEKLCRREPRFYSITKLCEEEPFGRVTTVGLIQNLRTIFTRTEETMYLFTLENRYHTIPCVVFPKEVQANQQALQEGNVVKIHGLFQENDRGKQIVVNTMIQEDAIQASVCQAIVVQIEDKAQQTRLLQWADNNKGPFELVILAPDKNNPKELREYSTNKKITKDIVSIDYLTRNFVSVSTK